MEGWIKLHRKVTDNWIFKNSDYFHAWITILLTVNHAENKVLIHNEVIICGRGQSLLSIENWTKKFGKGWSKQRTRTFFELLKKDSMIETEGLQKTTRLTVCNYDNYQDEQHASNTQTTRKQHVSNTQLSTNNNIKKEKNDNNNIFVIPDLLEVKNYCDERNNNIDYENFYNFYQSKGWLVGKTKMKDWKACIRTWEKNKFLEKKAEQPIKQLLAR